MIRFLLPVFCLISMPAQATDTDMMDGRQLGHYPLYQNSNMGTVQGNATLFQTEDGKIFGMTCAHCVPYLNSLSLLVGSEKKHDVLTLTTYFSIDNIKVHPLYKENGSETSKTDARYDIALFTIIGNSGLKPFAGEISKYIPQLNETYATYTKSYGPVFSEEEPSYKTGSFHQISSPLQFDKEGVFFHPFQARDFYISFSPTQNGNFIIDGGILSGPDEVNLVSGDSGSLVISEGKAIALASLVVKDVRKLCDILPKELLEVEIFDEQFKRTLPQKFEDTVATHTKTLKGPAGQEIFLFTLKENIPSIQGSDYYTPLALHADFIQEYIKCIPESPQAHLNKFSSVKVNNDAGLCVNVELVEEVINQDRSMDDLVTERAEIYASLTLEDKELVDSLRNFNFDEDVEVNPEEELKTAITMLQEAQTNTPQYLEELLPYYKSTMSPADFEHLSNALHKDNI